MILLISAHGVFIHIIYVFYINLVTLTISQGFKNVIRRNSYLFLIQFLSILILNKFSQFYCSVYKKTFHGILYHCIYSITKFVVKSFVANFVFLAFCKNCIQFCSLIANFSYVIRITMDTVTGFVLIKTITVITLLYITNTSQKLNRKKRGFFYERLEI